MISKYKDSIRISILLCIVASLLWIFAFNMLHYPKDYESLYLFYAGSVKDYQINNLMRENLCDESLRNCEIVSANPSDSVFETKYNLVCFNKCDIAILPIDIIKQTACSTCFIELSNNYGLSEFKQEDTTYGLYLSDKMINAFSKYLNFSSKEYVLAICQNSVNYGELTSNAYSLIEWMVNYEAI